MHLNRKINLIMPSTDLANPLTEGSLRYMQKYVQFMIVTSDYNSNKIEINVKYKFRRTQNVFANNRGLTLLGLKTFLYPTVLLFKGERL